MLEEFFVLVRKSSQEEKELECFYPYEGWYASWSDTWCSTSDIFEAMDWDGCGIWERLFEQGSFPTEWQDGKMVSIPLENLAILKFKTQQVASIYPIDENGEWDSET